MSYPRESKLADVKVLPNADSADPNGMTRTAVTTSSGNLDITKYGGHWITLKAIGGTVYFRAKKTTAGSVTTANGWPLAPGEERDFYVRKGRDNYLEHIGDVTCSLGHYLSDPDV
jgi:hypothetical protein